MGASLSCVRVRLPAMPSGVRSVECDFLILGFEEDEDRLRSCLLNGVPFKRVGTRSRAGRPWYGVFGASGSRLRGELRAFGELSRAAGRPCHFWVVVARRARLLVESGSR